MKYIIFSLLFLINGYLHAQYNMSNTTITTCSGNFYDSGGPSGQYTNSANLTMTFCPGQAGSSIVVTFTAFDIESSYEYLKVYAGPNATGTLLYNFTGTAGNGVSVQSSPDQCLTFVFTSDGSVTKDGWSATINCTFPCQNFSADIISTSVPYSNGDTIDVCQGQPITFTASGTYPNNNTHYAQNNATTTFHWDFGDGTIVNGATVTHTFTDPGGYFVILTADDVNGCDNSNFEKNMIRVSTTPIFVGTTVDQDTICLGETVNLSGIVTGTLWGQVVQTEVAGTTFLPDNSSGHYTTTINHNIFNPGQTLTNVNQLLSVCVNMEHSYLGDLTITMSCPSGQTVTMIEYPNDCSGTYLGIPIDDDSNLNPGTGYDYCWTPTATNGTWNNECSGTGSLPAGNYQTETSLSNLIGCTLNGDWAIDIFDNISMDNGFIFSWELHFAPSIIPTNLWEFTNSYPVSGMSWTGNGVTSNNATASATPTITGNVPYTFHVIDDFGCTYDTTIYVHVLPAGSAGCCNLPTPNAGQDNAICGLTYSFNAIPSQGIGTWSLQSGPGTASYSDVNSATSSVTVSTYGVYTFEWEENNGASCINGDIVEITFFDNPSSSFTVSNVLCYGDEATITYTGTASTSATYSWEFDGGVVSSGSGQGPFQLSWPAGSHTVLLYVNQNGCYSDTSNFTFIYPELLSKPNAIVTHNLCNGNCEGTSILTFQGGTYPFSYNWIPTGTAPTTDSIATDLCAGNYAVTITDINGCTETTSFIIEEPSAIIVTTTNTGDANCGQSNGSATVSASGGTVTTGYTYLWDVGNNIHSTSNTGLPEGFANVTVTDNNNCIETGMVSIGNLAGVVCDITSKLDASCFGKCDGNATVTMTSNGTAPFTYKWSTGYTTTNSSLTNTLSSLCAGFYTVTLTDAVNCSFSDSVTILQPEVLAASIISNTNNSCFNSCDGASTVEGNGGTAPYTYMWSTTQSSSSIANVCAGIYNVTINDSHACSATTSTTITEPMQLSAFVSDHSNTSCNDVCDGTATLQASYGTPPYSYIWSAGGTMISTSALCAGKHTVTVTDANGCSTSADVTITEPALLSVNITTVTDASCNGYCDGSSIAIATGGTAPYSYLWSNGVQGSNGTTLCAGNHFVTATDNRGCTATTTFTVGEPTILSASINSMTQPSCYGKCDGKAGAVAFGGTPGYTFSWQNGAIADTTTGLCYGNFSLTVFDSNGCSAFASSTLSQPGALKITATPLISEICIGQNITLNSNYISGGTLPIVYYIWSTGETGPSINVNPQNTSQYQVYARDINGCISNTVPIKITVNPPIKTLVTVNKTSICPGDTLNFNAIVTGGNGGPYIFSVNDELIVNPPFQLVPQGIDTTILYVFEASDLCNSPSGIDSIYVTLKPIPPNDFSSDIVAGCQPLAINFLENSPNQGQSFFWNFGDNNFNNYTNNKTVEHIYNEAGIYDVTLTVKGSNLCTNTITIEDFITVYPKPKAKFNTSPLTASIVKPLFYFDNISSTTYRCYWSFGDNAFSNDVNVSHEYSETGEYTVQLVVESDKSCFDTTSYIVFVTDEYTFYYPTAFTPDDDGINDIFYVTGSGINPEYYFMYIYDRWGELVFQTTTYDPRNPKLNGWDGKIKGQAKAAVGSYKWIVIYKDNVNVEHQRAGTVTIIR
jgi:gliding motility-associated-like protein